MNALNKNRLMQTCLALLMLAGTSNYAQAQGQPKGDGVGNEEVVVVKEYEATIQDAQKVNIPPNIPEVEEKPKTFNYSVPAKDLKDFSFEPNPLKPIALSKEKFEKYNTSFIKVGFGSQIMPIAQLAYNDNKTKNLKFGFNYDHLSAMDYKKKLKRFSDDEAGLYLRYFPKRFEVGLAFDFHNNRTHFFGTDSAYERKTVRQVLRNYDGLIYFKNAQKNKIDVDIKQTVGFNYLQETFGKANEWYINGNTDFSKGIKKVHAVIVNINFDISKLKNDSLKLDRGIYTFDGGYSFNNDDWKAHALLGITINGSTPYLYADAHVEKRLYEHSLIAYANYTYKYQKNSLNSFIQQNNFIQNWVDIRNTIKGDFALGFKGTVQNFSYNLAFRLNHINNMPLYINDTLDTKRFIVVYEDKMLLYGGHFELGYNTKEWLRLTLMGDYNYYKLTQNAYAWHTPDFKATLRANYIWKNKISLTVDVYGVTGTRALLADNNTIKLPGTVDANIGIEYLFNKHVAFWGMINNIANQHYQRYYKYDSYGINGAIGAKFSF